MVFWLRMGEQKTMGTEVQSMAQEHRLRRSRRDRIIGGVCGGLSEFFGISVFWFRLAFLIALFPGGVPGLLPYLIMWIVIPSD
jgi:phage shock protein C